MPNFLHRTTKAYSPSVSYADLPEPIANYVEEPDLSAVTGQPNKYWIITGDVVTLMDAAARAAVDAAELTQQLVDERAIAVALVSASPSEAGVRERAMIELHNKRINYVINRLIELHDRVQAMLDSSGGVANMRSAGLAVSISPIATRPKPAAVTDYEDDISSGAQDT